MTEKNILISNITDVPLNFVKVATNSRQLFGGRQQLVETDINCSQEYITHNFPGGIIHDISPDDAYILWRSYSSASYIREYDIKNKIASNEYFGDEHSPISSAKYSSDNKYIIAATRSNILIWDRNTKQILHKIKLQENSPSFVTIHPNNKYFAIGSYRSIKYFDIVTGKKIKISDAVENIPYESEYAFEMSFSPNGRFAVISGESNAFVIFDPEDLEQIDVIEHINGSYIQASPVITADSKYILCMDKYGELCIMDVDSNKWLDSITCKVTATSDYIILPYDNKHLIIDSFSSTASCSILRNPSFDEFIIPAISNTGKYLADQVKCGDLPPPVFADYLEQAENWPSDHIWLQHLRWNSIRPGTYLANC